jgi:hypothetical protein
MQHPTTSPLAFLVHALLSLFTGAFAAGSVFAIQQIGSDSASVKVTLAGAFGAFGVYFVAGFIMLEKNPQTAQAARDAEQAVIDKISNVVTPLISSHQSLYSAVGQLVGTIQQLKAAIPPTATVLTPNPTPQSLTMPTPATANTWNQPVAPVPGGVPQNVPQQQFPTPLKRFDTNTVGVVPGP